ncbi:hypothetical protein CEUSTIGMA_g9242.t1 [Chlamydomonas eustigma]|uniref:Methyltransferase small domain-containing protein n=1 Tax=Chlamydomonas eustigma TaxID=1157962 RepID=A0A250XFF3_9CHLO|nr:hypothetical protein CEUSTIGMA_g9242.t1 [Chlamydomonas eustigma]|eukprot:GAX81814.1 hypothetical protein CEUSTIGMA_g9242.t1 [Chlamydomonas eustigma]
MKCFQSPRHSAAQQLVKIAAKRLKSRCHTHATTPNPAEANEKSTAGSHEGLEGVQLESMQLGPFPLLRQRLRVGCETITLVMPSDVDQVLDMYISAGGINDGDPYWTRVWPSSIALAAMILSRPELVRGKRVADVGCGLGLAGIAASLAGASEVVLLDREALALKCALLSAAANDLPLLSPGSISSHESIHLEVGDMISLVDCNDTSDITYKTVEACPQSDDDMSHIRVRSRDDDMSHIRVRIREVDVRSNSSSHRSNFRRTLLDPEPLHGWDVQRSTGTEDPSVETMRSPTTCNASISQMPSSFFADLSSVMAASGIALRDEDQEEQQSPSSLPQLDSAAAVRGKKEMISATMTAFSQGLQRPSEYRFILRDVNPGQGLGGQTRLEESSESEPGSLSETELSLSQLLDAIRLGNSNTLCADSVPNSNTFCADSVPNSSSALKAAGGHVSPGGVRARVFDWNKADLLRDQFDVLLACDVLYEDMAVEPIAHLVPSLLSRKAGSRLLLADPPNRTARNRDRFLRLLQEQHERESKASATGLVLEECSIEACQAELLDVEMSGGAGAQKSIPVQLMIIRRSNGGDTVGVKSLISS